MFSSGLTWLSQSHRARTAIESLPVTRAVVQRFVAGPTTAHAVCAARTLLMGGSSISLDLLGEGVTDVDAAGKVRDGYLSLIRELDRVGLSAGADFSLKLSALGRALPGGGQRIAVAHAQHICAAARAAGSTVTLDMEEYAAVESTLLAAETLRADFPETGSVLQSNLRRTEGDVASLLETRARVRLVKGAYREPPSLAYRKKAEVDDAYARQIQMLMSSQCYPMIATHDPKMLALARSGAQQCGRGFSEWECQMLLGVRLSQQNAIRTTGATLRVYVPFGTDWYAYFMRRLAERPANVMFFLRALTGN